MLDLSICIPSIRVDQWPDLLNSIDISCTKSWEVIFVGPQKGDDQGRSNVKWIESYRHPTACTQIGLINSSGKTFHLFSDDCIFDEGSIDKCMGEDLVVANYWEGGNSAVPDFSVTTCYPKTSYINSEWVMCNTLFAPTELIKSLGGFDCGFEVICVAQADLGNRIQSLGHKIKVNNTRLAACGHEPNITGTHAPMHYAQLFHDIPRYIAKFSVPFDTHIDINNWESTSEVWNRRF